MSDKKYYETVEFEKLQNEWYEKLKKDGFEDAESKEILVGPSLDRLEYANKDLREAYYYDALHFLTNGKFDNDRDAFIWKLHTDGIGVRAIMERLRAHPLFRHSGRYSVTTIIKKYATKMREEK